MLRIYLKQTPISILKSYFQANINLKKSHWFRLGIIINESPTINNYNELFHYNLQYFTLQARGIFLSSVVHDEQSLFLSLSLSLYIYIYIYIYVHVSLNRRDKKIFLNFSKLFLLNKQGEGNVLCTGRKML